MSKQFQPSSEKAVSEQVRALYTELARCPTKDFGWGKGIENARALGYDPKWLERLPEAVWESSASVGKAGRTNCVRRQS